MTAKKRYRTLSSAPKKRKTTSTRTKRTTSGKKSVPRRRKTRIRRIRRAPTQRQQWHRRTHNAVLPEPRTTVLSEPREDRPRFVQHAQVQTTNPISTPAEARTHVPTDAIYDDDGAGKSDSSQNKIYSTIDYLAQAPQKIRQLLLTGLFGVGLGAAIDYVLGGPLGLTSKIIRFIISLIPGGRLILSTIDTAVYLIQYLGGDEKAAQQTLQAPQVKQMATQVQNTVPKTFAAEKLIELAAERQLGHGGLNGLLLGVANAAYLAASLRGRGLSGTKRKNNKCGRWATKNGSGVCNKNWKKFSKNI
ncbi:p32K [Barthadenovirus mellis]|uniref:P32K n=1 Tax=Passerine adenovirus 1 TaxID=2779174 RepID=A0A7L9DIV3_9ADEN|nr:p32K [Passerine adenovirus 1]